MRSLIVVGLVVLVVGRDCEAEGKSWAMFVLIRTTAEQWAAPGNKVDREGQNDANRLLATGSEQIRAD